MTNYKLRTRYGTVTISLTALAFMTAAPAVFAQTLYVEQIGATGTTTAPTSGADPIFLDEFTTSGTQTMGYNSYNLSTVTGTAADGSANQTIVESGTAGSEGAINYAGNYLTFAGYNDPLSTTSSVVSGTENRGVGIINLTSGAVDTSTSLTAASTYNGNNIRSAVTADGTHIYTAGTATAASSSGGVRYTTDGNTTSSLFESSTNINTRVVEINGGYVYFSTGSAVGVGTTGVYELGADTSSTAVAPTAVATSSTNTSPYSFAFYSPNTTTTDLYVADSNVGVEKFVSTSGGAFSLSTTLAIGNLSGITVDPLTDTLYGAAGSYTTGSSSAGTLATFNSAVYSIKDNGTTLSDTTLFTASNANYNFRGLQLVDSTRLLLI